MRVIALLLCVSALVWVSNAAKILAVAPTPTKSHHYLVEKLAVALATRGHQVTFITPFPQEKPLKNLEEIIIPNYYDSMMGVFMGDKGDKPFDLSAMQMNIFMSMYGLQMMGLHMAKTVLSMPAVKEFIQSNRKYDAVIGEAFFVEPILAGFVKKFNAPLIAISPGPTGFYANYLVGNPSPSAYVPSLLLGFNEKMTFEERLTNFVFETISSIFFHSYYLPKQDQLMREHFGNNMPDIKTIMTNTSLVLVNHHHSLAFPRPYLPNMIEIGGYHVKPLQPLPKDIQQYMDESKNGVILLSMGSHMKSSLLPKDTVQAILRAFSRLKENVIWKFDSSDMPGRPKNVRIMKWLPQSDILAHPNLKLLITHGGMLSTTEAVMRRVPFIGLPAFGDQPGNMKFFEKAGYAKTLSIVGLTEDVLYDTITEMLRNPKYKENVNKASALLQDTPKPALETAIYWIEYVIRHKGAPHLRSAALDLEWYQLYLLDVLFVFAAVAATFTWMSYRIVKAIWRKLFGVKPSQASKEKKTN